MDKPAPGPPDYNLPANILENIQAAYVVHDRHTQIIDFNRKALELLGLTADQILGKTAMDPHWHFVDEEHNALAIEAYPVNLVLESQQTLSDYIVGIVSSQQESITWVLVSAVPIRDDAGDISHVIATFMDVTEQVQAKKRVRENERRFRAVITAMHEGLVVQNQDSTILECNPAAEKILGLTASQICGRKSIDERWRSFHEDGSPFPGEAHPSMVTLRTGEPQTNVIMGIHKPDDEETWISINTAPIFDGKELPIAVVATFTDITRLKKSQEALISNSAFLSGVIEAATDGLCVCHATEEYPYIQFTIWNDQMTSLTGYTMEQINELGWYQSLYPDPELQQHAVERMQAMQKGDDIHYEEWPIVRADGEQRILSISSRLLNAGSEQAGVLGVMQDITESRQAEEKMHFIAHHDQLTMLPNRLHFYEQLEHTIQRSSRDQLKFAILFIDLDRFKHINDSFGHPTGDKVLLTAANRIKTALRKMDVVARLGGDEFVVLLEDVTDLKRISSVSGKIIDVISEPIEVDSNTFYLSASIGISLFPDNGTEVTTLISNADAAMYRAKEQGRNTFQFYTRDMTDDAMDRIVLERDLRHAMAEDALCVHLQPVYNGNNATISGAEVLVRWPHHTQGYISPDRFIPLAEESGMIDDITTFVLNQACNIASDLYHRAGMDDFRLSINLSAAQLHRPGVVDRLLDITGSYDFPQSMLEFELTESIFACPTDELIKDLNKIRQNDIFLTVDDFGTGYSSLVYLKRFPLDKLKIDRSFVSDIPDDDNDVAITRAIIALGTSLQLKIVAEGVETDTQRQFLLDEGCTYLQGFFYSKPLPVDDFYQLLDKS